MKPDNFEEDRGATFKQVIDKCTNLLTVIGIFNAISIYASTLLISSISKFLSVIFLLLAILLMNEVMLFSSKVQGSSSADKYEKLKTSIFVAGIYIAEALLLIYTVKTYWSVIAIGSLAAIAGISGGFVLFTLFLSIISSGTNWKALLKFHIIAIILLSVSLLLLYLLPGEEVEKLGLNKF